MAAHVHLAGQEGDFLAQFFIVSEVFWCGRKSEIGHGGNRRIHEANLALPLTIALVMVLAFDLDRAGEGLVAVNQQPMINLYKSMRK